MRYSIFGYLIGEGFRNVFKNRKSTIASVIIMCATMFIFGIFFIIGENVNHMIKTLENQQGMEVFIYDEATEAQTIELGNKIRQIDYVNTVTYKTKEDALEQMKKLFKDRKSYLSTYEEEGGNPFKASYVVTLTDLNKAEEVQNKISGLDDIIAEITIRPETIEMLIKFAEGIKIISNVILVILVLISIFIITNTIKLSVHARRKEISIMKYVGATNGFIRWPFMVEGMIIGLIAVLISLIVLTGCYNILSAKIEEVLISQITISLLSIQDMFKTLLIVYLVLGLGVGALGSGISMKKYLQV